MHRIFLLSPARSSGKRAGLLFSERAQFDLARRIRLKGGVPIGEVFAFLSGLYFRGKLTYAQTFAKPPPGSAGAWVITTNAGLLAADQCINLIGLRAFAETDIDEEDPRYREPLLRDAGRIARRDDNTEIILLGSVATGKYVDVLLEVFGDRLKFPAAFVGRGDMSRGGLLLRCAVDGTELDYIPVRDAARKGKRPPKLATRRYS